MTEVVEIIKQAVSCQQFAEHIGLKVNRAGFICCPFHGEKTASLKLYPKTRGWYCFGCGAGGDVISFAKRYYGITFTQALERLNYDFALGLQIGQPDGVARVKQALLAAKRRIEAEKERERKQEIEQAYWEAYDKLKELDETIERLSPKSADDEFVPPFVDAVKEREWARHVLAIAESRRSAEYASK